jgi:hypothetical protein
MRCHTTTASTPRRGRADRADAPSAPATARVLTPAFALALALAGCSSAGPGAERAQGGETRAAPGAWMRLVPEAAEIDGQWLEPICSGVAGGDPSFHFWARRGAVDKLVVFFEGGGACWSSETCAQPILEGQLPGGPAGGLYKGEILSYDDPTAHGGLFTLDEPRNPVRDWHHVYVPYCTGDVHSGSHTARYTHPVTGEPFEIAHRGADNFRLVLAWMRESLPAPGQILVAGSSAGAYGAITHYPRLRALWPSARAALLADGGQGVSNASFRELRNANWSFQLSPEVYGPDAQATSDADLLRRLAAHYPNDRFGQYTTAADAVQIQFYDVMLHGRPTGKACRAWTESMLAGLAASQREASYRSYLAAGETHTLLRGTPLGVPARGVPPEGQLFYTERSAGGVAFTDWLAAMLSERAEGWENLTCSDCTSCEAGSQPSGP